jgi:glycogen synthase
LKILVISNFYPPHYVGGYELGCRDIVEGLGARGHQVSVLTSKYGVNKPQSSDRIYRWLSTDFLVKARDPKADLFRLLKKELQNQQALKRLCRLVKPDLIYIWNLTHISVSLPLVAHQLGYPLSYFVSDHWLSGWENDAWYAQWQRRPKRSGRRLLWDGLRWIFKSLGLLPSKPLDLSHVQFASHYLKQAFLNTGKQAKDAEVIHWGIDHQTFSIKRDDRSALKLLYVGQLITNKGIQTAVEALKILLEQYGCRGVSLTIAGGPDYDNNIHRLVAALGLESQVTFTGLIPRERLPQLYQEHGILVFPSVWDEPFSITLLEAMASGLAIVGTQTGGSFEILEDGVNALVFTKENAKACAEKIIQLINDRELYNRVRHQAHHTVEKSYRLAQMIERIEWSLRNRMEGRGPKPECAGKYESSIPLESSFGDL